ncbi:GPW/gp25 family protein [Spirulina major CS-329]|uniref:GPW/gp25 family protein n=1 Tax=Spirulina TaxID=1154 RepID=UPI0023305246|nr:MULTISPECIES: GPW/gp25 family protein [Spirulina]MDB9494072.1 GPW/gp25 family protein [Spirulina subsalsa CS-330]MDB9504902.1 GPW/gp25 family protein [Spirulina major CS-329]
MPESPLAHIGTSPAFPLSCTVQGGLQMSRQDHNVAESIRLILGTRHGERVYRPNFGSRLSELVFAPMNSQTLLLTRLYVEEAIRQWEPRIELDGVFTQPDPVRGRLDIIIQYHFKDTHDSRSLVYPFYLTPPS